MNKFPDLGNDTFKRSRVYSLAKELISLINSGNVVLCEDYVTPYYPDKPHSDFVRAEKIVDELNSLFANQELKEYNINECQLSLPFNDKE
ncbi:hypothetical protein HYV49_03290 [Candidatus Pacearchaeota archaeon]|nr:hypothetical protein [Candidatus Pacearchaeota archaeon]